LIVKAVDKSLDRILIADVNPIKKNVKIVNSFDNKKTFLEIYSIPSVKLTFRKYFFPVKKIDYLEKSLKTQLSLDLPIHLNEIEYRYVYKESDKGLNVFCVIVRKEDLKEYPKESIVDTEIFSLLRLAKFNGIDNGLIYHFTGSYVLKVVFKENFPEEVRVLEDVGIIEEDAYISGIIEDRFRNFKVLNNLTSDPSYNVAFGLAIKSFYSIGVDFLKKDDIDFVKKSIKNFIFLAVSILIVNLVFFISLQIKNYELKKIKEKEKEIFFKYWQHSGKIYSPLTQAKGILKSIRRNKVVQKDATSTLEKLGRLFKLSNINELKKVYVSEDKIVIEGIANSNEDIEKLKKYFSKEFNLKNEEINSIDNKLKFRFEASNE